jgi:hypothetical protein
MCRTPDLSQVRGTAGLREERRIDSTCRAVARPVGAKSTASCQCGGEVSVRRASRFGALQGQNDQNFTDGPRHEPPSGRARASAWSARHQPSQAFRPGWPLNRFNSALHLA